jgi:hypothetical protein
VKISILLLSLVLLSGCSGMDSNACQRSVVAEILTEDPNADVASIVDISSYSYLIRKADGSIWMYKTMNLHSTDITSREQLMPPLKNPCGPEHE